MAALRDPAIGPSGLCGWSNNAAAIQHHHRDATRLLATPALTLAISQDAEALGRFRCAHRE
ncbi:hypothetical protein ACQPZP_40625 [Spirillospora sp. CA-142024]|uniref:hypothetical protein n=1 Tax=Spirillospora sp. CA-142024 TaxID=3240036 RepID=UPI003D930AA2